MRQRILVLLAICAALAIGVLVGHHAQKIAIRADDGAIRASAPGSARRQARIEPPDARSPANGQRGAPLPPPGTPLKQTMDDLQARAEAGDAEAASRLYRDLQRCAEVHSINQRVPDLALHHLNKKTDRLSPDSAKNESTMLGMIDDELKFARDNAALCDGVDGDEVSNVIPAALQAANLGDTSAASCYLGSDLTRQPDLFDHLDWLNTYKDNALTVADAAVSRGDWTVVKQLAFAYKNVFAGDLLSQVTGRDSALAYRYLKLWRLGAAPGQDTEYTDIELAGLASQLPPDSLGDADAWAQDAYRRYFSAVTPYTDQRGSINICQRDGS